jgi:hypothetical protein
MTDIVALIREASDEKALADSCFSEALRHAFKAGELLTIAKAKCPRGEWYPLLREHWRYEPRTAPLYMQLWRDKPDIERKCETRFGFDYVVSLREALRIIQEKGREKRMNLLNPYDALKLGFPEFRQALIDGAFNDLQLVRIAKDQDIGEQYRALAQAKLNGEAIPPIRRRA